MKRTLQRAWVRLVALGFHLLYHELAWTYDMVSWLVSFGAWRKWQQSALPYVRGPAVLELGHGPGHILVQLAGAGYTVVGLDRSPQMGRIAAHHLRQRGLGAGLIDGSAQTLPFEDAVFNTVLATFPTEYIVDPGTLQNIHRVLAGDGRLVIVPAAYLTGSTIPVRLLEWLYTITGQRAGYEPAGDQTTLSPNWRFFQARLAEGGFDCQFNEVQLEYSRVTVIVATPLSLGRE